MTHARFCTGCGAALPRAAGSAPVACSACGRTHYRNPTVRAACIAQRVGEATSALWHTALGEGEEIQIAALRSLGAAAYSTAFEGKLALYATVTDMDSEQVFVVFRLQGDLPCAALDEPAGMPVWSRLLIERFDAERRAGIFAVYAGCTGGDALQLHVVADDR